MPTRTSGRPTRHDPPVSGHSLAERDYAFLETDEGEEVYVHRNAVVDGGFDRLKVGNRVRYVVDPEEGEKGAQAGTVIPFDGAK